jgi:hypothetical protein
MIQASQALITVSVVVVGLLALGLFVQATRSAHTIEVVLGPFKVTFRMRRPHKRR